MPHHNSAILIPKGAKRILIFSNCKGSVPAGYVKAGDLCVHINKATHWSEVKDIAGTWHELIVRHGNKTDAGKPTWFNPAVLDGFDCIHFTPTINGWGSAAWWRRYVSECGKNPTSGFLAYRAANMVNVDKLPVVLMGFNPAGDGGTYKAPQHGWEYEAKVYEKEKAVIVQYES